MKGKVWRVFWGTIITLLVASLLLDFFASKKLQEILKQKRENRLERIIQDFKKEFPDIMQDFKKLHNKSIKQMEQEINSSIDRAFEPLYGQIESLSEFHYSVEGEYTELLAILAGEIDEFLQKKLFEPVQFDKKMNQAIENINKSAEKILHDELMQMKSAVQQRIDASSEDMTYLFDRIVKITHESVYYRFENLYATIFRAAGITGANAFGAYLTKTISKKCATAIGKKVLTKLAVKGGVKVLGSGAGVATGLELGTLCGPAAWICSPIGGIVGGIVGWFTTDKIIIEIDRLLHEDEFKRALRNAIDEQKESMKKALFELYVQILKKIYQEHMAKFERLKREPIKKIIQE